MLLGCRSAPLVELARSTKTQLDAISSGKCPYILRGTVRHARRASGSFVSSAPNSTAVRSMVSAEEPSATQGGRADPLSVVHPIRPLSARWCQRLVTRERLYQAVPTTCLQSA